MQNDVHLGRSEQASWIYGYLVAKVGFNTAENKPFKVSQKSKPRTYRVHRNIGWHRPRDRGCGRRRPPGHLAHRRALRMRPAPEGVVIDLGKASGQGVEVGASTNMKSREDFAILIFNFFFGSKF